MSRRGPAKRKLFYCLGKKWGIWYYVSLYWGGGAAKQQNLAIFGPPRGGVLTPSWGGAKQPWGVRKCRRYAPAFLHAPPTFKSVPMSLLSRTRATGCSRSKFHSISLSVLPHTLSALPLSALSFFLSHASHNIDRTNGFACTYSLGLISILHVSNGSLFHKLNKSFIIK